MEFIDILKFVEKPGRYLGGEWNERRKDFSRVRARVALVFPDVYEIGMSYLGQKILYSILNDHPSILAERVFAPWVDFERILRSQRHSLFSLENKIPLQEFDILGFSLPYELNYSNILTILDLAHIPFRSSERGLEFPLVIGGGPAAFNPEPVAEFFDLFFIGDGEEGFIEIIEELILLKKEFSEKREILKGLARIKGVYVPSFYENYRPAGSRLQAARPTAGSPSRVEKRVFLNFRSTPFPEKIIVPSIRTVFDRVAVEVSRGCPQRCRFCQAASIYFPYRAKDPSLITRNILNSLDSTGYEDVSLMSLSISDYPYLDKLVEALMDRFLEEKISLSLSSLRPKGLSLAVVRNIVKVRKTGFTLVPEAGTERLRRVINKSLDDQDVLEAAANAFTYGWRLLKLYFMVGLPTERDEDLDGIVRLIEEIVKMGTKVLSSPPRINLSISSFIPKPHTPFQWLKMEDESTLREKHGYLKSRLKKYRFIQFKEHLIKNSILEGIYSRGDRELARVLERAWKLGARFDSWKDQFSFGIWENAFQAENVDFSPYLALLPKEAPLPWDHIDCGLKKSHLLEEMERALREEVTAPCLDSDCGLCQGCIYGHKIDNTFEAEVEDKKEVHHPLGKSTAEVLRYRAFYRKTGSARFLSHLDLINVIQRSLRRAGIPVAFSEGFHPKMLVSFLPALPLGMEGKAEVFEFKSNCLFSEAAFLKLMNQSQPSGIEYFKLVRVDSHEPGLNQSIETMVYSLSLDSLEVQKAVEELRQEDNNRSSAEYAFIQECIHRYGEKNPETALRVAPEEKRLYIQVRCSAQRSIRVQKIIEDIFRIQNPVSLMAREKVTFRALPGRSPSRC